MVSFLWFFLVYIWPHIMIIGVLKWILHQKSNFHPTTRISNSSLLPPKHAFLEQEGWSNRYRQHKKGSKGYWTAAYTGALSSLSQGNEMNRMNVPSVVCCFQFIYIFPWPFNIVYGPCLLYIKWYHDHNVFTKSYSWNFITTSFGGI